MLMTEIPGLDVLAFLKLIESPYDTQAVFDLIKTALNAPNYPDIGHCFLVGTEKDQGLQKLYREGYVPRFPTNEELLKNPPGSLGRLLADHLISNNISLDFQGIELHNIYDKKENFVDYSRMRGLRVHDILHVVLGADISPIGEGQAAAFQAAQYGAMIHATTLSFVGMHVAFYESKKLYGWILLLGEALQAGMAATPFYGVPWEEYFAENLDDLRRRFNIRKLSPAAGIQISPLLDAGQEFISGSRTSGVGGRESVDLG
jgi:ubiquinone biosynthesis protein Coq4